MTRRSLLTSSIVTAIIAIAPSAFSAAVVHDGALFSSAGAAGGKAIVRRDVERLFVGTRANLAAPAFSLAIQRAGGLLTLTGIDAVVPGGETLPALVDNSGLDESIATLVVPNLSPAPAPAAAPEAIGSASSFAAVPEPSSIALVALGAVAFLRRRRG